MLVTVLAACFDLYSRIKADAAGARVAVVMAEYVAGATAPDGNEMNALGAFLHEHEFGIPANLVYVISAFRQPPGEPPPALALLWSDDSIRFGDAAVTGALAGTCAQFVGERHEPALPDGFTMAAGEVLIIAEVCAQLTREGSLTGRFLAGDIYRLHAVPARDPSQPPAEPAYSGLTPKESAKVASLSSGDASIAGDGTARPPPMSGGATGAAA